MKNQASSIAGNESLPWLSDENFPTRPETGATYGFWSMDRFDRPRVVVESTEKLLKETLRREPARIQIVWTPDHPHGVPPQEVDFLKDEALSVAKEGLLRQKKSQIIQISLAVLGLVVASLFGYGGNWLVWLLVAIVGLSPALNLVQKLRNRQKSDAESLDEWAVQTRFATWLRLRPSYWSGVLVGLFVFILGLPYLLHLFVPIEMGEIGTLIAAGLVKDLVKAGEYWRLLSAGYLHLSFSHFWFNSFVLWYLGRRLEEITHPLVLPIVFVLGVIGGSLMSVWLDPRLSAGASGGILAVMGMLLGIYWRNRAQLPAAPMHALMNNVLWIAVIGAIGFRFIDNAGHAGGLLTGLILSLWLPKQPWSASYESYGFFRRPTSLVMGGLLCSIGAVLVSAAFYFYMNGLSVLSVATKCQNYFRPELAGRILANLKADEYQSWPPGISIPVARLLDMDAFESGDRVLYRTWVPLPYLQDVDYPLLFVYYENSLQWLSPNADLNWYSEDRPTISVALNCLGAPDRYEAYFGMDRRFKFVFFLHYDAEGIVVETGDRGNYRLPLQDYVQGKRSIRLFFNNAKVDSVAILQSLSAEDYVSEVLRDRWLHIPPQHRQMRPWPIHWSELIFTQVQTVNQ